MASSKKEKIMQLMFSYCKLVTLIYGQFLIGDNGKFKLVCGASIGYLTLVRKNWLFSVRLGQFFIAFLMIKIIEMIFSISTSNK